MNVTNILWQVAMWVLIVIGIITLRLELIAAGVGVGIGSLIGMIIAGRVEFGTWTWWRR